jgi:hypothetical protein
MADLRKSSVKKVLFCPLAHFYFLLIAIKKFNIYINKGKQSGLLAISRSYSTNQSKSQVFFTGKSFSFSKNRAIL